MSSIRMPLGSSRAARASASSRPFEAVRLAALALGGTSVAAVAALAAMFSGAAPLGTVNDVLNGVAGWVAVGLAVAVHRAGGGDLPLGRAGVAAAAVGAVGLTWGSWLVVTETTGFFLAGLVSTLGLAGTGAGLLLAHRASGPSGVLGSGPARLGRVAGWLMAAGVLAVPGAVMRVDDLSSAPWHVWLAEGPAWLGFYVVLPIWCLRLARGLRPAEVSSPQLR